MAKKRINDVVIVGCGHTGLTCALALAKAGLKVVLLDANPYIPREIHPKQYDSRVSNITEASIQIFQQLGVWDEMVSQRVSPFDAIEVWKEGSQTQVTFLASDVHYERLGCIIENGVMQNALFKAIQAEEAITYCSPVEVQKIAVAPDNVTAFLSSGDEVCSSLLIGADGAYSTIRQLAGFSFFEKSYEQSALVATVKTARPHQKTAYQHFLSSGPLAFLPLDDEYYCSIVWSHRVEAIEQLCKQAVVEFDSALQAAFGSRLGEVRLESERKAFPLMKRHVDDYVHARIALIGDAAHTVHPLAGQGLNLGLADAMTLAKVLIQAANENRDIGLLRTLRKYARERKFSNQLMLEVVELFHQLFREESLPKAMLSAFSFKMTNRCLPLRKKIIASAMGMT